MVFVSSFPPLIYFFNNLLYQYEFMFINFILSVIIKYCVLLLSLEFSAIPTLSGWFLYPLDLTFFFCLSFPFSQYFFVFCHYKMFIFSAPAFESAISQRSPRYIWGHIFSRNQDVGIGYAGFCYWGVTVSQFLQQAEPGNICMPANLWYTHLKLLLHLTIFIYIKLNLNSYWYCWLFHNE